MRDRGIRRAGAVCLALGLVALVTFAAGADAQSNNFLLVRKADAVDPANVKLDFIWTGNPGDVAGLKMSQRGSDVPAKAPAAPLAVDKAVVIVIDTGPGMDKDGALVAARKGATDMVNAAPGSTRFAVVQAGDKADLRMNLSTDRKAVIDAIDGGTRAGSGGIGPTKGSAIGSALRVAGGVLSQSPTLQPNVVLAVADNESVNAKDEASGRAAVATAGATVWVVERLGSMDPAPYEALISSTGGQVLATDNPTKMADLMGQVATTIEKQQYSVAYNTGLKRQDVSDLSLTVADQTSSASFIIGGVYQGSRSLRPNVIAPAGSSSLFSSQVFFLVALLLALLAAAGIAYALTSVFVRDDLSSVLQPYADAYGAGDEDEANSALGSSALIARAVQLTEQVAENQGLLTRAEGALERANLPLRAGEALFIYVLVVLLVTAVGLFLTRNMIGGIVCGVIGALLPVMIVNFLAKRRRKAFMSQLPDTLSLLSGTLKAGYSLMQGVEAVSQEVQDPMGIELRRVVTEARLGRPLEEALDASADRMDSPDFAWAVMAIRIQREVGGNLSELLMTVADTMVQRERLRRDVAALTAEGRVSAAVLGVLPAGIGLIMYVLNPEYVGVLFSDGLGIGMLITAGLAMLIGFMWMKKIINIEI